MSNKLTEMARDILDIEADLPYRFDYSDKFMKDVLGCNVASVYESGKYKV